MPDKSKVPNHPLRDIGDAHFRELAQSLCNYTFDCARRLMLVNCFAAVSPPCATYFTAHDVDRKEVFNIAYIWLDMVFAIKVASWSRSDLIIT